MNGYYREYLDNIKFLINNKDKLTEKQQQYLACLQHSNNTRKTYKQTIMHQHIF